MGFIKLGVDMGGWRDREIVNILVFTLFYYFSLYPDFISWEGLGVNRGSFLTFGVSYRTPFHWRNRFFSIDNLKKGMLLYGFVALIS